MDRLTSGIPVIDRAWNGLRTGGTYVLSGRAQSGHLVGLRMAQAVLDRGARCVYVAEHAPADLVQQTAVLGFDVQAAAQAQRFRLLRPPALPEADASDEAIDRVLTGLITLARQSTPGLLIVEDFTPFLRFDDLDRLASGFVRLVTAIRANSAVLIAGVGMPANDRSSAIVARLRRAAAGTIEVRPAADEPARKIQLHPGTDPAARVANGTWTPGASAEPASTPARLRGARFGEGTASAQPATPAPPPASDAPGSREPAAPADAPVPSPAFAYFDVPAEVPYGASESAASASHPSPSDPHAPVPFAASPTPTVRPIDLAAATYDVNPHLNPSAFEFDGGVLLDSADAEMSARALDGTKVTPGAHGIFRRDNAPGASGDGMPVDGAAVDFTGAPEFDPLPPAPEPEAPRPAPPSARARPDAPMPQFASLVAHTFDRSPRGRFSQELQAAFDRYNETGEPFLALALRMDPANPFAEAFPLVADAVREAVDERDPIYAEPDQKRMVALLPERTQQATGGIFAAIKAQLQLSGGASDAVFTAIAAVAIPNGEPFANARDLVTFAFDAD